MTDHGPGDYIRRYFSVPAKQHMRVRVGGKPGTITGFKGRYLRVRLDGDRVSTQHHPINDVEYLPDEKDPTK